MPTHLHGTFTYRVPRWQCTGIERPVIVSEFCVVMIRAIMSEIDVVKGLRIVRERIQAASKNRGPVSEIL